MFLSLLQKKDKVEEIKAFPSLDVKAGIGIVDCNNCESCRQRDL